MQFKALSLDCYHFSSTKDTDALLDSYQTENDPVLAFWKEIEPALVNDLIPWDVLYPLFQAWSAWSGADRPVGSTKFRKRLTTLLAQDNDPAWVPARRRPARYLSKPEPVLYKYKEDPNVKKVLVPTVSKDSAKMSTIDLGKLGDNPVTGLLRVARPGSHDEDDKEGRA